MMDPIPEGTKAIVDDAIAEAAQSLFTAADVPLARTDELLAALQGPAVRSVFETRIAQILKHGYSVEGDRKLPLGWFGKEARETLQASADVLVGERKNLKVARKRAVIAAAFILVFIDRIDFEMSLAGEEAGQ
jgi:hypothetical protein